MLETPMNEFQTSDGLTLSYRLDDYTAPWHDAETVILLHAAMGSSNRLYAWAPHLAGKYRVVRPDLRGHGRSQVPAADQLDLARLVLDLRELMDDLGIEKAHIAGSSAGGIIAMRFAIDHPDRIASLGAFAAIPGLKMSAGHTDYDGWIHAVRSEGIRAFLSRTIEQRFDTSDVHPGFIDWFLSEADRNDADLICRFVGLMAATDFSDEIGGISCPTLAVVPGGDPNQSDEEYAVLRDRIPDCEFVVYPGMRHNITDAVPDRCAIDLLRFIEAQDASVQ